MTIFLSRRVILIKHLGRSRNWERMEGGSTSFIDLNTCNIFIPYTTFWNNFRASNIVLFFRLSLFERAPTCRKHRGTDNGRCGGTYAVMSISSIP